MEDIVVIGAGGFGREVQWLIERINMVTPKWNILGFVDDGIEVGTVINNTAVLGNIDSLLNINRKIAAVCAVAEPNIRKRIISRIKNDQNIYYPNLVDPGVIMSDYITMGVGNIICASSILTVNITINNFVIIDFDCTVGHDAVFEDYTTLYPSVNISGYVTVEELSQLGTGSQIIQSKKIGKGSFVGAGAVVVNDIEAGCVAVGCPAKPIKRRGEP